MRLRDHSQNGGAIAGLQRMGVVSFGLTTCPSAIRTVTNPGGSIRTESRLRFQYSSRQG
jgi:hypothetical protein